SHGKNASKCRLSPPWRQSSLDGSASIRQFRGCSPARSRRKPEPALHPQGTTPVFYVAICLDKPDSQQLRLGNRAAHLDYLRAHADAIKTCGPFVEDDGTTMVGSLLVIDAPDRAA